MMTSPSAWTGHPWGEGNKWFFVRADGSSMTWMVVTGSDWCGAGHKEQEINLGILIIPVH